MDHLRAQLAKSKKAWEQVQESLTATKVSLQESEGACQKLKLMHNFWKAKALRTMKQLSFTPYLQDQVWTQGFHWGFESFRTLVQYLRRSQFDLEIVDVNFLPLPQSAIDEVVEDGKLFLDVPMDKIHSVYPKDTEIPPVPSDPESLLMMKTRLLLAHVYVSLFIYI
jgi:hypothetical protein